MGSLCGAIRTNARPHALFCGIPTRHRPGFSLDEIVEERPLENLAFNGQARPALAGWILRSCAEVVRIIRAKMAVREKQSRPSWFGASGRGLALSRGDSSAATAAQPVNGHVAAHRAALQKNRPHIAVRTLAVPDHFENGIAPSPTYHRAFDNGLIFLDDELRMRINPSKETHLATLGLTGGLPSFRSALGRIHLPPDRRQWPSTAFVGRANRFRQISA
jgi:hypothetical protein